MADARGAEAAKPALLALALGTTLRGNDSAGGKINCHYISKLQDSHDITILCKLSRRERTIFDAQRLSVRYVFTNDRPPPLWARLVNKVISAAGQEWRFPFFCYLDEAAFAAKLRLLKRQKYAPSVVVLDWTHCIVLARRVRKAFPGATLVGCEQDVSFLRFEREAALKETPKERRRAERVCRIAKKKELSALALLDRINVLDEKDARLIGQFGEKVRVVAPYFDDYSDVRRTPRRGNVIFFGAMSRPENYECAIWFIENVLRRLPEPFTFTVIGGTPSPLLQKRAGGRVTLTGFVDDPRPYFADALCMAVPLSLGAGIKIKVLEAMSAGIPVLTNAIGIEGIPARDGTDYIHCESADDYERAILALSEDEGRQRGISESCRAFVRTHFDYTKCSYV